MNRVHYLALVLLVIHGLLVLINILRLFPTRNEVAHLPAGISHWEPGISSLYKVNPPLWRMLAVLPALPLEPKVDGLSSPSQPNHRNEWATARVFALDNAVDYRQMMELSRIAGVFWSILGGVLVLAWSKRLYGPSPGLIGIGLWCFDPNIMAYAALLTPDMPLTVAGFGATYLFWRYLQQPTWEGAFWCGIALGIAQLTRFTALLLYGIWPALWLVHLVSARNRGEEAGPSHFLGRAFRRGIIIVALSVLVINTGYAFDSSFRPLKEYRFVSEFLRGEGVDQTQVGNRFKGSWLGEIPVPLPADYVEGIDLQRLDFEKKLTSYLGREIKEGGWWYYYLYGFMVKVPLGTIALIAWAAVLTLWRKPPTARWRDDLFLWLPPLVIFAFVSSQDGFSRHFRYVLPIFPFLFVAVARLGCYFQPFCWRMAVPVLVLLAWSVGSSLAVFPHSLSYFNELAGGPDNGHNHLIDSNIDWGQDLWFLKDWVEKNPEARPFSLAYYNFIDHKPITGMDYPEPPGDPPENREGRGANLQFLGPHAGYFAVDIHNLKLGGHTYFERFRPIAKAGYSIFIYHITPEEADAARGEMGLPPLAGGGAK